MELRQEAVKQYMLILAENRVKVEVKSFVASAMEKILSHEGSRTLKIAANREFEAVLAV